VFTDGVVEINDVTIEVAEVLKSLEGAGTAAEAVARLVETVKGQQGDDVTVIALRRTGDLAAETRERQASPLQV
jgi:hypothetical protein